MIVDTFVFAWELDLLECRLIEMDSFVDQFIFTESNVTFQGKPKPYIFEQNISRFLPWTSKITYIKSCLPQTDDPWAREIQSREQLLPAIAHLEPNDIILHGDVDEIIPESLVKQMISLLEYNESIAFEQTFYSMAIDWLLTEPWQGTVAVKKSFLDNHSMIDIRNKRVSSPTITGGWHLSWLGGPDMIRKKAESFSHTEDEIQSYIKEMGSRLYTEGYHVRREKLIPVNIDETYPSYIKERKCPSIWFRPQENNINQDKLGINMEILETYEYDKTLAERIAKELTEAQSDKASYHQYHKVYAYLFKRKNIDSFLEIGLYLYDRTEYTDLFAWEKIFPQAKIYGADRKVTEAIDIGNVKIRYVDQSNNYSLNFLKQEFNTEFDIILDDASHIYSNTINTFESLFSSVKNGGLYLIEDMTDNIDSSNSWQQNIYQLQDYMSSNNHNYKIFQSLKASEKNISGSYILCVYK